MSTGAGSGWPRPQPIMLHTVSLNHFPYLAERIAALCGPAADPDGMEVVIDGHVVEASTAPVLWPMSRATEGGYSEERSVLGIEVWNGDDAVKLTPELHRALKVAAIEEFETANI